jgi:8-oxo-dGTP pyrophosphatase MutT (NUDIX family)
MTEVIEKVTAFITRERDGVKELLVFKHPTAGIQIPAGTVEEGEDLERAVKREAYEETGLRTVEIEGYLGSIENELGAEERIVTRTTQVYMEPNLNAMPYKQKLTRGLTVDYNATHKDFTNISEIEYDRFPNPTCIVYNITGWVPSQNLSTQKRRHFFHLTTLEETADAWELKSDRGHIFRPYWTPISPKPPIVSPQSKWLDRAYNKLSQPNENAR